MKAERILEELTELSKRLGYSVRRETGTFRGGGCVLHDQRIILINKSMPHEAAVVILARAMSRMDLGDDAFLKPALREILDRERIWTDAHPEVTFAPHADVAQVS